METVSLSASNFVGLAALSILIKITLLILWSSAASIIFWVPRIFVLIASKGFYSQRVACFRVETLNTISIPSRALFIRSLSLISQIKGLILFELNLL